MTTLFFSVSLFPFLNFLHFFFFFENNFLHFFVTKKNSDSFVSKDIFPKRNRIKTIDLHNEMEILVKKSIIKLTKKEFSINQVAKKKERENSLFYCLAKQNSESLSIGYSNLII